MSVKYKPIGYVQVDEKKIPRHWSISNVEGRLVIDEQYEKGLKDIKAGQRMVVIFHFHKSPAFDLDYLVQTPSHLYKTTGVFSICSPLRPNPIGMSVLTVLDVKKNIIRVKGLDMLDSTPILDIKPCVSEAYIRSGFEKERC